MVFYIILTYGVKHALSQEGGKEGFVQRMCVSHLYVHMHVYRL